MRPLGLLWVANGLLLTLVTATGAPARAQTAVDAATYEGLIDRGVEALNAERWLEAEQLFDRAHGLRPNARTLRARGVARYQLGAYLPALRDLRAALNERVQPLTPELAQAVQALVTQTEERLCQLWPRPTPADAQLTVNGEPAEREPDGSLWLAPGRQRLRFAAQAHAPIERELSLRAGSSTELIVTLPKRPLQDATVASETTRKARAPEPKAQPSAPPVQDTWPLWLAGATSAAFAGAAAGLWLAGDAEVDQVSRACAQMHCSETERTRRIAASPIGTYETLTNASLAVSGAALTALGLLFFARQDAEAPPMQVAADGRTVVVRGRF